MIYDEILNSIRKEICNIAVIDNNRFFCYIENRDASKAIYTYIEKFDGDVTEFAVRFEDGLVSSRKYVTYDSVDKFIKDFKDIEEAVEKVRKIANSVVFF